MAEAATRPLCLIVGLGNPGKKYDMTRHNIGFMAVRHVAAKLGLSWKMHTGVEAEHCSAVLKCDLTKEFTQIHAKQRQRELNRLQHAQKPLVLQEDVVLERAKQVLEKTIVFPEVETHFVLPQSYMNLSGGPVHNYVQTVLKQPTFFKYLKQNNNKKTPFRLLVVYDDVSIPFGRTRLLFKGGDGGHNGLASIEKRIGTERIHRMRLGIAPNAAISGITHVQDLADFVLKRFSSYDEQHYLNRWFEDTSRIMIDYVHKDFALVMNDANNLDITKEKIVKE